MRFNKVFKQANNYIVPDSCNVEAIYIDGLEIQEYLLVDNVVTIDESVGVDFKYLCMYLSTDKRKLITYGLKDSVFQFFNNTENTLESNSKYEVEILPLNQKTIFNTQFSPMYCKERDVLNLIKPILKHMEEAPDIEYEIFVTSDDILNEFFDEDTDWEEVNMKNLAKLVANKTAYNILYNYYYQTIDRVGETEERVGTLSERVKRDKLDINTLLRRFEDEIDRLEELFSDETFAVSFTKASGSSTGLDGRLWETNA